MADRRRRFRGKKKRRCIVCKRARFYCSTPIGELRLSNPYASVDVLVDAGAVVCDRCLEHNGPDAQKACQQLPVACSTKCCHRCGGSGKVRPAPGPSRMGKPTATNRWWECPNCRGKGQVAA